MVKRQRSYQLHQYLLTHFKITLDVVKNRGEHYFGIHECAPVGKDLKIKEALHIRWQKPTLNQQIIQFNVKYRNVLVANLKLRYRALWPRW